MAEALKAAKEAFGSNAVILGVKTTKAPGRFLGKWKKQPHRFWHEKLLHESPLEKTYSIQWLVQQWQYEVYVYYQDLLQPVWL